MAATFTWSGTYGVGAGTVLDLGTSGNLFNFKSLNSLTSAADYTTYTVVAGTSSYEVFLRGKFTGTFNRIANIQAWKSSGGPDAGITLKWDGDGNTAYTEAVSATSVIATTTMPTGDPGTANVSIGNALTGALSATGYTDYMVLQLQSTTAAAAGDSSTYTFSLSYDES